MRLRVKIGTRRYAVELPAPSSSPDTSLHTVKQHITAELGLQPNDCYLSLNGEDVLDETQSLSDLGIISGDLLHVMGDISEDINNVTSVSVAESRNVPNVSEQRILESSSSLEPQTKIEILSSRSTSRYHEYCKNIQQSGIDQQTALDTDVFCLALHLLMLDTGFVSLEQGYSQRGHSTKWMYSTPIHDEVKVHLACMKMGKVFSIHGMAVVKETKQMVSLNLPVSEYIVLDQKSSSKYSLHKTRHLANVFKDNITNKLITDIRKVLGLPEIGTFSSLFPEMKLLVLRYLNVREILSVSATDRELYRLCQDPFLWKQLLLRDFPTASTHRGHLSWKQLYVEYHKMMIVEERRRRREFETTAAISNWHPLPFNPLMIGGRYDWLPPQWPSPNPLNLRGDPYNHPVIRDHMIPSHDEVPINIIQQQRSSVDLIGARTGLLGSGGPLARLRF